MFQQVSADNAPMGGPLLHALTIPPRDANAPGMSPAEAIASSLVSPSDTYSSGMSPTSSHGGPFTPADALHLMSLVQHKDVPENVDADNDVSEMPAMPYGFWPGEALWTDMENLMPDDFNLSSIPPVELGLGQFEALPTPQQESTVSGGCGEWMGPYGNQPPHVDVDFPAEHEMMPPEEHDFDDVATPGGPDSFAGMFAHEHMNW